MKQTKTFRILIKEPDEADGIKMLKCQSEWKKQQSIIANICLPCFSWLLLPLK
jgi:hypothetical protein